MIKPFLNILNHLYDVKRDITFTDGTGLDNFGLSLALMAFEQRGNFIVSYLLRSGPRCKRSHLKDRPI